MNDEAGPGVLWHPGSDEPPVHPSLRHDFWIVYQLPDASEAITRGYPVHYSGPASAPGWYWYLGDLGVMRGSVVRWAQVGLEVKLPILTADPKLATLEWRVAPEEPLPPVPESEEYLVVIRGPGRFGKLTRWRARPVFRYERNGSYTCQWVHGNTVLEGTVTQWAPCPQLTRQERRQELFAAVEQEMAQGRRVDPPFRSGHEGWGVLYDAVLNVFEAVRDADTARCREWLVKAAAVCVLFVEEICVEPERAGEDE